MEAMEFLQSPDSEAEEKMVQPIFDTVRVETEVMPPLAELGRQLLAKAQEGDAEAVLELMRQGAPFTTDWLGTSALHWACQLNHIAVAEVLLRAGISRDARNKVDRTPLHVTAQWGFVDILKLLLANGVDVDARDMLHMAPLHWAAEYSHEECVRLLLEHGADPEAVNKFDKTADQIAFDNNRLDITHMIQEYAENPMRHVRRKEAKERQKKAAAAIKASIEKEKMLRIGAAQARALQMQAAGATTKPQTPTALPTVLQRAVNTHTTTAVKSPFKLQNEPVKEVRVLKIPRLKRLLPEPITIIKQENPLSVDTPIFPPVSENNTEKTMELLQAHGITMLPNEENTIVASAMQSGQKVVLTEAGKMALNLTERPLTLKGRPVKGLIKLPEGALKGKRVITIRADQLINMTKDRKVIINTEKIQRDNAISPVKPNHALQTHVKQVEQNVRINVPRSQNPAENNTQLTSSFTPEPQPDTQQSPSELLVEEVSVTEQKSEVDKLKRELIQSQMQVKHLREQFLKKEKEAFEYKRILELLDKT